MWQHIYNTDGEPVGPCFSPQTHCHSIIQRVTREEEQDLEQPEDQTRGCLSLKIAHIIKLEFATPHWTQIKLSLYEYSTCPQTASHQPIQTTEDLQS